MVERLRRKPQKIQFKLADDPTSKVIRWHPDDGPLMHTIQDTLKVYIVGCATGARSAIYNAEARVRRVQARDGTFAEMKAALLKPQRAFLDPASHIIWFVDGGGQ